MEIVSPESIERDYETKGELYQDAGVEEYWIVDEVEQKVTLLRLVRTANTVKSGRKRGNCIAKSCLVFGFAPNGCGKTLCRKRSMC